MLVSLKVPKPKGKAKSRVITRGLRCGIDFRIICQKQSVIALPQPSILAPIAPNGGGPASES